MMDQGMFQKHFVGRDGFIWWIGQVADENTWRDNLAGFPVESNEDEPGFGERYKVRIMGYHTAAPTQLKDEDLPWATVMYPVTAGGGGRGSSQNANLTQGCFVFGFFLDGENAQQPVIMGCMGYNNYQEVMRNVPDAKFLPFEGSTPKDKIATNIVRTTDKKGVRLEQSQKDGTDFNEVNSSSSSNTLISLSDTEMKDDGEKTEALSDSSDCVPIPTANINTIIRNTLSNHQRLERAKTDRRFILSINIPDIDKLQKKLIAESAQLVSGKLKNINLQVEKSTIEKINTEMKKKYNEVFPNERQQLKEEVEKINDNLSCAFRNLADGLETIVSGLLEDMVKKAVNAPPCMADNMIGSLIGQVANSVENTLQDLFGTLNGITSFPVPIQTTSQGGGLDTFDIIEDIVSVLQCDQKPNCSKISELSLWGGGTIVPSTDLSSILNIAKGFSDKFNDLKMLEFDPTVIAFDELFGAGGCNSGPVACGPPTVKFFGGEGSGAAGNLIISALGEIMSIDMVEFGINYDEDVNAVIIDTCGKGTGGVIKPVIGTYIDPDGNEQVGVTNINVVEPGTGYLSAPDGSTGGDGKVWANPGDTSVTHADGTLEIPTPPGNIQTVVPGDIVLLPPGTEVVTEPLSPADIQDILTSSPAGADAILSPEVRNEIPNNRDKNVVNGFDLSDISDDQRIIDGTKDVIQKFIDERAKLGASGEETIIGGKPHVMEKSGRFTTPSLPLSQSRGEYPSSGSGAYPAITYLCEVIVQSPGYKYSENDEIIIEPNAGAIAIPKFNKNGSVESVKVTAGGEGFTQMPDVYIKSETGYNVELLPVFCVERIGKDEIKEYDSQSGKQLITVIDCVGKIDRNQFVGYVNGKPYYGPFHFHPKKGVKMVGARHVPEPHDVITDRPNTPTERPFINADDFVAPDPKPIRTNEGLSINQIDSNTVEVTNLNTGQVEYLSSETGIDISRIQVNPEDGTISF